MGIISDNDLKKWQSEIIKAGTAQNRIDKIQKYKTMCYMYGFITLCYMINDYAREDNYEECQIILDAINGLNNRYLINLPTTYDDAAMKYFRSVLQSITGTEGITILNNIEHYVEVIKNYVK